MDLDSSFKDAAARLGVGSVTARFCPYSELKHTWTRTGRSASFKISDYLENAPDEILASLGHYLVAKAFGKQCDRTLGEPYLEYARSSEFWEAARERYLARAKSLSFDVQGGSRNMRTVFNYVNTCYFADKIPVPNLAWVSESPRRRLGFYFEPLRILAANRALDSDGVPRYVLEFVMFHELLHHMRAGDGRAERRVHHTREFREQERRFSHFDEAEAWLRKIVSRR